MQTCCLKYFFLRCPIQAENARGLHITVLRSVFNVHHYHFENLTFKFIMYKKSEVISESIHSLAENELRRVPLTQNTQK